MFDQWIQGQGRLKYGQGNRLVVNVDPELTRFYRSLIPKHISFNIPKYYPHITVVRGKWEAPLLTNKWMKRENEIVYFEYSPNIQFGGLYIWLPIRSEAIGKLRQELGLNEYFWKFKEYHLTIANVKEQEKIK